MKGIDEGEVPSPNASAGHGESERPTLKTIARLSGLAVPTVSRALNDAPDIGRETKRRVRDIADQIGYRPNRAGVRLRTGRTNVISLVLSTENDMTNHTTHLISSIAAELRGTPYHLIITPFFPDEDPLTPIRYIVETGSADGIIINQIQPEDPRVRYMMERDFPFVTHGRTNWCHLHAYYDFDNGAFGRNAVETLFLRGRRRLMLLPPPQGHTYSRDMVAGASAAAAELGVAFSVMQGATADSPLGDIDRATVAAVTSPDRPDGFIVPHVGACIAMVTGAESSGMVLGETFDMVAKEAAPFLDRFRKGILIMPEDLGPTGAFLSRAVIHRINHPGEPPMQYLEIPHLNP